MKKYCNYITNFISRSTIVAYLNQRTVVYKKLYTNINTNSKSIFKARASLLHRLPEIMIINISC